MNFLLIVWVRQTLCFLGNWAKVELVAGCTHFYTSLERVSHQSTLSKSRVLQLLSKPLHNWAPVFLKCFMSVVWAQCLENSDWVNTTLCVRMHGKPTRYSWELQTPVAVIKKNKFSSKKKAHPADLSQRIDLWRIMSFLGVLCSTKFIASSHI